MPEALIVMDMAALLASTSAVLATFVDLYLSSRLCGAQLKGGHTESFGIDSFAAKKAEAS